jgi:peptidoglycan/xylan/chitin deacetylase (PgdA/CDA1 family)
LERQIKFLAARGYQSISLDDFCEWQARLAPLPPKPVIITFDDGYAGFLEHVAPVLERYSFRATIFLIAGMVGQEVRWEGHPTHRIMGREEVAELARRGYDIQSHGLAHHDWTRVSGEVVRNELTEAARIICNITGRPVRFVAYPYGRWNRQVRDLVESAGFAGACTVQAGRNDFFQDRFLLKRSFMFHNAEFWRLARELHR